MAFIKTIHTLKLEILATKASSVPPIGPILGQYNINIMKFCTDFNKLTENIESFTSIPVIILVHNNQKYSFIVKKPTLNNFIFNLLTSNDILAFNKILSIRQLYEIALYHNKLFDIDLKIMYKSLIGSIDSMSLVIEE